MYLFNIPFPFKCSKSCRRGVMTRQVECQLTDGQGITTTLPDAACASQLNKPSSQMPCNGNIKCGGGIAIREKTVHSSLAFHFVSKIVDG